MHQQSYIRQINRITGRVDYKSLHLLDLLWTTLIQPVVPDTGCFRERLRKILKGFLGEKVFDKLTCKKKHVWDSSFRNIEELKLAGIRLKPGKTSSMRGISFSWGTLRIPPIIVDDSIEAKLLNLAAYEMCPDFQNEFEVSTYIFFMDSLIDSAQDVKVLRESGILHNALGSDKEVVKLFNKINTDLVPNQMLYSEVQRRIQSHYDNTWMTWIAQFIARHFHSPWSVLAFIAAILALASSIVQTVYTVQGYYKPDNHRSCFPETLNSETVRFPLCKVVVLSLHVRLKFHHVRTSTDNPIDGDNRVVFDVTDDNCKDFDGNCKTPATHRTDFSQDLSPQLGGVFVVFGGLCACLSLCLVACLVPVALGFVVSACF
ncbi:hypothetical protein EZV62_005088 [Acer yangbiense]|uniref:Uncharacterized protein n=1 Tax=Acer yangbiense TaxID=1000413 RepID=A0A5C7ILI1_9ROSI|nr:hypothetical protein EZV62_005088 [Acer yangbiense]